MLIKISIKKCSKCKIEKPLNEFGNKKKAKDGKQSQCKNCISLYNKSNKAKKSRKKYKCSDKGVKKIKEYEKTNICKKRRKISVKKYRQSEKGKISAERGRKSESFIRGCKKYKQTDKGKENIKKGLAKRQREFGFIPLNNILPNSNAHHINKDYIIYIPKEVHQKYRHRQSNFKSMIIINKIAWEYLYLKPNNINIDNLKKFKGNYYGK